MQHTQHLSDEAIAAFADGVLSGHARERAARHTSACAGCNYAVAVQREAVWALRAAPSPDLPSGLMDRLRGLPQTTLITSTPAAIEYDGTPMMSVVAPMAAFVAPAARKQANHAGKLRPVVGAAAALAAVGVFAAGSGGHVLAGTPTGPAHVGVSPATFVGTHQDGGAAVFVDTAHPTRR